VQDTCAQNIELITDANGKTSSEVCEGKINILLTQTNGLDYLFMNREVINSKNKLSYEVGSDMNLKISLGEGPFTIPILNSSFKGISYVFGQFYENRYHGGLDIEIQGNGPQPIYAPVNGMVNSDGGSFGECNHVTIKYEDPFYNTAIYIGMGHLSEIEVKPYDEVKKGDLIGYINPDIYNPGDFACTSHPHIHMNIWASIPGLTWSGEGQDGGRWEILPAGEWGVLDPELFLAKIKSPTPLFTDEESVAEFSK